MCEHVWEPFQGERACYLCTVCNVGGKRNVKTGAIEPAKDGGRAMRGRVKAFERTVNYHLEAGNSAAKRRYAQETNLETLAEIRAKASER